MLGALVARDRAEHLAGRVVGDGERPLVVAVPVGAATGDELPRRRLGVGLWHRDVSDDERVLAGSMNRGRVAWLPDP